MIDVDKTHNLMRVIHYRTKARVYGDLAGVMGLPKTKAHLDELSELLHDTVDDKYAKIINRYGEDLFDKIQQAELRWTDK